MLGFIVFRLTLDGFENEETLYVFELQVAEAARRLGLGKHLMQVRTVGPVPCSAAQLSSCAVVLWCPHALSSCGPMSCILPV